MSALVVQQRPAGVSGVPNYSHLQRDEALVTTNLGGRFALPREFNTNELAGGFYLEGQEAHQKTARETLIGTPYTAPGWTVWKYPKHLEDGKTPHPFADKPHKIAGTKEGEHYVLMCRPRGVQEEINHAYGVVSIERMVAEQRGETLSVEGAQNDTGMLTEQVLRTTIGKEQEIEEAAGRQTAVHSIPSVPGTRTQRVSR